MTRFGRPPVSYNWSSPVPWPGSASKPNGLAASRPSGWLTDFWSPGRPKIDLQTIKILTSGPRFWHGFDHGLDDPRPSTPDPAPVAALPGPQKDVKNDRFWRWNRRPVDGPGGPVTGLALVWAGRPLKIMMKSASDSRSVAAPPHINDQGPPSWPNWSRSRSKKGPEMGWNL